MTCRYAVTADLPSIHRIWSTAFPADSASDRTAFLEAVPLSACMVAECDGDVVSMVFSLTAFCGEQRLQYIYAAATLPAYRGRGLFGQLLLFAQEEAKRHGCIGSFLRPAEPSLADYYARFGYTRWWYSGMHCGTPHGTATVTLLSPAAYTEQRRMHLPSPHIDWDTALVQYAVGSEEAYAVDDAVALCHTADGVLTVKEWLGEGDPAALCAALGCSRYTARTVGADEPFVLYCPFDKEYSALSAYVGLVFD